MVTVTEFEAAMAGVRIAAHAACHNTARMAQTCAVTITCTAIVVIALSLAGAPANADRVIETRTLTVAGKPRTYFVHQPAGEGAGTPRPLLLLLHGSQSSGRALLNEWIEVADHAGVTLLAPNATTPVGWRIRADGPDYLRAVIDDFATRSAFDRRRLYLFGVSGGAVHALTLGSIESEYFAAVAIWAGAWRERRSYLALAHARRKIPIALFIGDRDEFFPIDSVQETAAAFRDAGHPVQLMILPGQRHDYHHVAARLNPAAWDFLQASELPAEPYFQPYD
jgi:poly(3-hydroxybutyrate) depolymerase